VTARYVIVESHAAQRHAAATLGDGAHWVTMSPYVAEVLRAASAPCLVLDATMSAAEADAVGYAALDAAKGAAGVIDAHAAWPQGLRPGEMLVRSLQRAIASFLYKAALMDRLRAEIGGAELIAVGDPAPRPVTGFEIQTGRFDTLLGTFAESIGGRVLPYDAPKPTGSGAKGDFMRPSLYTRLVTVMNAPGSSVFYRLSRRLAARRPRRVWFGDANLVAAIHSANELVEETVAALARRGARLLHLAPFPAQPPRRAAVSAAATLERKIAAAIAGALGAAGFRGAASAQVAPIIAARTLAALSLAESLAAQAEAWCDRLEAQRGGRRIAVLANAISAPTDHMLAQRLMARGIPLYVFEHGTGPGLDENHEAVYRAGLPPLVDGAVYYTENQRAAEEGAHARRGRPSVVAGAPAIARRIGFPRAQRWLARRALSLPGKGRVLTWVTGLYPNNMTFLPHYFRDASYHALRRKIVYDVLGKLGDHVLLKLYPTYRHIDPDPFAGLMQLPGNCRAAHLVDFRNLRAAADVILLDTPGSTLAWCWGAGVPLVYLDTEMRLTRTVAREFDRAFFYIDTARDGWADALAGILHLPHAELLARWHEKAHARAAVGTDLIMGPDGHPGRVAARYIIGDAASAEPRRVSREIAEAAE
jgi:hypothetical protein